jgi:hypothetical protein
VRDVTLELRGISAFVERFAIVGSLEES